MTKINFTGHGVEITDSIRSLIEKKFKKVEKHFSNGITSINVILSLQKLENIAEINLHVSGAEINASAKAEDMYKAIDQMLKKLDRQIAKHKEKMRSHREQ